MEREELAIASFVGKKFGRLTVVGVSERKHYVACVCVCRKKVAVQKYQLAYGKTKSCGCLKTVGHRRTHGMSGSRVYKAWCQMIRRCRNPKDSSYPRYGGRGIRVCRRWLKFENFLADMGPRPSDRATGGRCTIERRDNDGGYSPSNCKWATYKEQSRNRRLTKFVNLFGRRRTLGEWCEIFKKPYGLVHGRVKAGMTYERALFKEKRHQDRKP